MAMKKDQTKYRKRRKQNRWTPLLMALAGVLLLALAVAGLNGRKGRPQVEGQVSGAPGLQVDQERIDLGDMRFNQLAEVTFQVSNTGDQPLRFEKAPYVEVVEGC